MAYGVEFLNDGGKVQIGTGQNNFCMVQKGSTTFSAGSVYITIAPTVAYDAIAVVSESNIIPKGFFPTTQAASTAQEFKRSSNTPSGAWFKWYAFRNYRGAYPSATNTGWGMEVYNNDGSVSFTTANPKILKYTKVAQTSASTAFVSVPAGRTYAFIGFGLVRRTSTFTAPMGGGLEYRTQYAAGGHNTSTNQVYSALTQAGRTSAGSPGLADVFDGGVLACDVTNY